MAALRFVQRQHPVGQGGFHTGQLYVHNVPRLPLFNWVYDCGSNQTPRLHAEIAALHQSQFDLLFLSHLDADHVRGIDNFLACKRATEVVLPYLDDIDRTFLLAAALNAGSASGSFRAFVADPALWFGERGVERITYVLGSDDSEGEPEPPDPVEPGPVLKEFEDGEKVTFKWSRAPQQLDIPEVAEGASKVFIISASAVGTLNVAGSTLNWILSPFAVRPSPSEMVNFQRALDRAFGPGKSAREYAAQARTESGRGKLKVCYRRVHKTQNLHSMALYSGPIERHSRAISNTAFHGLFVRRVIEAGWLSTGDFPVNVHSRRNKLFTYFRRFANSIGQLTLPHHGSDLSFDSALLTYPGNLRSAVVAVGPNSYGHPGLAVQAAVAASGGIAFVRVDDVPGAEYYVFGPVT